MSFGDRLVSRNLVDGTISLRWREGRKGRTKKIERERIKQEVESVSV
jgi:hypothetical protein